MGNDESNNEKKQIPIDNQEIIENDCYEEIHLDKMNKILQQERKWNNNSIIYTFKDINFLVGDKEKADLDDQHGNKSELGKENNKFSKLMEESREDDECSSVENKKQKNNENNENKENKENNENNENKENKEKEAPENVEENKNIKQNIEEKKENNCNDINNNIDNQNKENNVNEEKIKQINENEQQKPEPQTKNISQEKAEEKKNNESNEKPIKNNAMNENNKFSAQNKIRPTNTGLADMKPHFKIKERCREKRKSNESIKNDKIKIQVNNEEKNKEEVNTKVINKPNNNKKKSRPNSMKINNANSNNEKNIDNTANNAGIVGEHKNVNTQIDIHSFIPEYKLMHLKEGNIIYSGVLEKVLHIPEKNTYSYSQRFCVLTKNEFSYYKSKEYYISVNKPLLVIKNSYINRIEQLNTNENYYYFIIICEINEETKDLITKVNSFVTNQEGRYTNLLLSFRDKDNKYINKWVAALKYFTTQKND